MVENNNNGDKSPEEMVTLDEKGQFLEQTVPGLLSSYEIEIGRSSDTLALIIDPKDLLGIFNILKHDSQTYFDFLVCISVVDYIEYIQIVYHLLSTTKQHKLVVKADLDAGQPSIPSLTSLWLGADWYEREGHDLFGVWFEGHPNLEPLLLYEGFEGHPGLKSYPLPEYKEW